MRIQTTQKSVVLIVLSTMLAGMTSPALAKNNKDEVKKNLKAKYRKVYFGPELKAETILSPKAIVAFAEDAAKWFSDAGHDIQKEAVLDMLIRGKGIPGVSGGIASIQNWQVIHVPYVKISWNHQEVGTRPQKVPNPNSHMPWVAIHKDKKKSRVIVPHRFLKPLPDLGRFPGRFFK